VLYQLAILVVSTFYKLLHFYSYKTLLSLQLANAAIFLSFTKLFSLLPKDLSNTKFAKFKILPLN
jgi:hypothetical protein